MTAAVVVADWAVFLSQNSAVWSVLGAGWVGVAVCQLVLG